MTLLICGIISLSLLVASILTAVLVHKDLRKSVRIISVGFFVSIFVALAPCHVDSEGYSFGVNLFDTICVMITQSSLTTSLEALLQYQSSLVGAYRVYLIALYVLGPLSVASATLSFVKGFGKVAYAFKSLLNDSYIFSSVNERAISVCNAIRSKHPKAVILFALDCGTDGIDEDVLSQIEELGGIVIRQSVKDVKHSLVHKRNYCLLDEDVSNNIEIGLAINEKYENSKNADNKVELLIYSTDEMSQIVFFNTIHHVTIHLFREEEIIANDLLFNYPLYGGVVDGKLNVLILGCGKIGYEILKKTIWSGYLGDGVQTQIHVIDVNATKTESKLKKECPSLYSECKIDLKFHDANINDDSFAKELDAIGTPTYIVVALGNEKVNADTCIYLRRRFGVTNGYPKLHMTTDTEDFVSKLQLVKVCDWSVNENRSFSNRIETEQDFEIKGFGSYERAYSLINPSESEFGILALACHVYKLNLSANGKTVYRREHETIQQFVNSLVYSYNQVFFAKCNADQLALSMSYILYALDYPVKCAAYLEQIRKDLKLSSINDIPFALHINSEYNLENELKANKNKILELTTERYNRFMYTLGWTKLPIEEIKDKSTRDQLRLRYARLGNYNVDALEKLINEGSDNPKNYRQNDIDEIMRLPNVLQIYDEIKDCK